MYERFTDRARKVMQFARQEAQRFRHDYIGTEHILLGLIKEGSGVATNVLKNLDVDPRDVQEEVTSLIDGPKAGSVDITMVQTPRAKKAIELAIAASRDLGHNYVGTEHLLLGLLAEGEGVAAQVLTSLGLSLKICRREVVKLLGPSSSQTSGPQPRESVTESFDAVLRNRPMLVLSRKKNENIVINGNITVAVVDIEKDKVRLGVVVPVDVSVYRQEVYEAIHMSPQDLARAIQAKPLKTLARSVMAELPDEESLYQRLTDSARAVLRLAREEAGKFNHEYVGTEHMLLGIVRQATGIAADVLRALDIDLRQIRLEVEKIIQAGPDAVEAGQLPLTPRAKKAIEYALDEAAGFGSSSVGTQHLLLGLLREEEGVGGQVLLNVGLSLTLVRRKLLDTLGHIVDQNAAAAFQTTRETELPEAVGLVRTEYDRQIAILQAQREAAATADDPLQLARLRDQIARLTQSRELLLWMFREPVH